MTDKSSQSYTGWLAHSVSRWVVDTFKMGSAILRGEYAMPDSRFFVKMIAGAAVLAFLGITYLASPYKLVYNYTPSEEEGWYLLEEISLSEPLQYDDLVFVDYRCPKVDNQCAFEGLVHYRDGDNLMKRVQGKPGDVVRSRSVDGSLQSQLIRNGQLFSAGVVKSYTQDGDTIPHRFSPVEPVLIPDGQFYVGNQVVDSAFDSRYFGLIHRSQITGKLSKL